MNARKVLKESLLNYWTYSKKQLRNKTSKIYNFSQTNLGATLAGCLAAGSVLTYTFGYSKLTQEKDQAIEALKTVNNTNAALKLQGINNQTIVSSLTVQNAQLLDDKITIINNNISTTNKHDKCISDMRQIATLHANSFFKPSIKPIIDEYRAMDKIKDVSDNRREI